MPVMNGRDSKGPFYRWGETGFKYRYTANNVKEREKAKALAARQGRAIKASQNR